MPRHPVTVHLPFDDHRAMAAYWGREAMVALAAAIADPVPRMHELELNHAVRSAKMAHWHWTKLRRIKRARR